MGLKEAERKVQDAKSKVKISKDFVKKFFSAIIVLAVLIVNGFMSFMSFGGMDFTRLGTSEYWLNYGLLTSSEIIILLCFYVFRKIKDLQEEEIVNLANDIKNCRRKIYDLNQVKNVAEWLRNYYNIREKLNLFEDKICAIRENLELDEPIEPAKEDKKRYKKYKKAKARYLVALKKYDWCNEQIDYIKEYRTKLEFVKEKIIEKSKIEEDKIDYKKIEKLDNAIIEIDKRISKKCRFNQTKIKYENVYWDTLTANEYETNLSKRPKAQFHEKKLIANSLKTTIALGLAFSVFILSMLPPLFNDFSWEMIISELLKIVMFAWFSFRGIVLADTNILFHYKQSLAVRKSIYNELNYDLGYVNIEVREENKLTKSENQNII